MRRTHVTPLRRALMVAVGPQPFSNIESIQLRSMRLTLHPFNLDVPISSPLFNSSAGINAFFLVADPREDTESLEAMMTAIRALIDNETVPFGYLRRIHCGPPASADAYFEVATSSGIFMCGGAQVMGRDGFGTYDDLDALFQLISMLYGVPYEVITGLTVSDSRRLKDTWAEAHEHA